MNHPTSLSTAMRTLDRHADATAHRDRARLVALFNEVFHGLLPATAWTERENHLLDVIWTWRLDLADRAGQALPRASNLAGSDVRQQFEAAVSKAVEGS